MKKLILVLAMIIFLGLSWFIYSQVQVKPSGRQAVLDDPKTSLESLQTGPYPWSTEPATLKERLNVLSLPALTSEGTTLHTHQHLDLYLEGEKVTIPTDIGVNEQAGFLSPVHTHNETGIIHVESPTVQDFTLGQFFTVWGVRFNDQCLGGYCSDEEKKLSLYLNGQQISDNYVNLKLEPKQEIVLIYGTASDSSIPIPSSYNFPEGY